MEEGRGGLVYPDVSSRHRFFTLDLWLVLFYREQDKRRGCVGRGERLNSSNGSRKDDVQIKKKKGKKRHLHIPRIVVVGNLMLPGRFLDIQIFHAIVAQTRGQCLLFLTFLFPLSLSLSKKNKKETFSFRSPFHSFYLSCKIRFAFHDMIVYTL